MSIVYAAMFLGFIFLLAWWEAELIKRGKSNHTPKWLWLIVMFIMMFVISFEISWKRAGIVIIILALEYFSSWDYVLNFSRKVEDPLNYKLWGPAWLKFIGLVFCIAFIMIYFFV